VSAATPRARLAILVVLAAVTATACGAPVRAVRVDPRHAHRVTLRTELTSGELSQHTQNFVYMHDLAERFERDPAGTLRDLHASFLGGHELREDLAALAELCFHHAERGGGRPYYLAAAAYAWIYLFPPDPANRPDRFSPRLRLACDLYNRGLTAAMKEGDDVVLRGGSLPLPWGTVDVAFDASTLRWSTHELEGFVPMTELEVEGLPTIHRWPGIGAPLAAHVKTSVGGKAGDILGRRIRVPVTALLRFHDLVRDVGTGRLRATLEVHPGYGDRTVEIEGQQVPLEAEPTAALALTLSDSPVWSTELRGFLRGALLEDKTRLVAMSPYYAGSIPVVFVHGTASSAGRWAELYNELDNDPRLHGKYQFWFFSYETGNPIAYSAMRLRDALNAAIAVLDPDGKDPALRRMVIIGHSQGGLLTKAMVTDSGLDFWRNVSRTKSIDEIRVSDSTRTLLRKALIFEPQPFVKRVIFLSTPQHGSYVAGSWIAHQLARLVRAPLDVTRVMTDVVTGDRDALTVQAAKGIPGIPSAVDNMTPGNPFVKVMAAKPIAPGVHAHSIIAIKTGVIAPGANDGVVAYDSAHIDGVDSELVVKSAHSCQANPHTITEVRRILLEHLRAQ
jgi:triacylglycerol esterase/lipase EstA (alpha/beta hydrolase family)